MLFIKMLSHLTLVRYIGYKYLSLSIGYFFILLTVSLLGRSFLVWYVPLIYFCFYYLCFWCNIKKKIVAKANQHQESSPHFLLGVLQFQVSHLSCNSFQVISVSGIRQEPTFILLHMDLQFFQNHLLNRLSFPTVFLKFVPKMMV